MLVFQSPFCKVVLASDVRLLFETVAPLCQYCDTSFGSVASHMYELFLEFTFLSVLIA